MAATAEVVATDKEGRQLTVKNGSFFYRGKKHQQEDRVYPLKPAEGRWRWSGDKEN